MFHPKKWGEDYFMDERNFPFKLVENLLIAVPPMNPTKEWEQKIYKLQECELIYEK